MRLDPTIPCGLIPWGESAITVHLGASAAPGGPIRALAPQVSPGYDGYVVKGGASAGIAYVFAQPKVEYWYFDAGVPVPLGPTSLFQQNSRIRFAATNFKAVYWQGNIPAGERLVFDQGDPSKGVIGFYHPPGVVHQTEGVAYFRGNKQTNLTLGNPIAMPTLKYDVGSTGKTSNIVANMGLNANASYWRATDPECADSGRDGAGRRLPFISLQPAQNAQKVGTMVHLRDGLGSDGLQRHDRFAIRKIDVGRIPPDLQYYPQHVVEA